MRAVAATLLALCLAWGCRDGAVSSSDGDGDIDADVDGDVDGDGDGDSDVTADEATARELCGRYVECAGLVTPAGLGPILDTYGPTGSCWDTGSDIVGVCAAACHEGLVDLFQAYPDESACAECLSESHCLDGAEPYCHGGRCVECRTADDCGEEAPICDADDGLCVSGACASASDTAAIEAANIPDAMMTCTTECGPPTGDNTCASECARSQIGVSEPCSLCVGELSGCVFESCLGACLDGLEAPGCTECLEASCLPAFEECSGLEDALSLW